MKIKGYDLKEIEKAVKLLQGFAKAFWKGNHIIEGFNGNSHELKWETYIQQMAIAPDINKYLEQFKDENIR